MAENRAVLAQAIDDWNNDNLSEYLKLYDASVELRTGCPRASIQCGRCTKASGPHSPDRGSRSTMVEVTPKAIRLRKRFLSPGDRRR